MRQNCRDFIKLAAQSFKVEGPVYEFGSRQVAGQAEFTNLREFFPGKEYIGCDYMDGPGVDLIQDVTYAFTIESGTAGAVILVDILEHCANPFKAMAEVFRILRPGGMLLMTVPFWFPIHDFPHDYFRYTPQGVEALLSEFNIKVVGYHGAKLTPHTVYAIAVKGGDLQHLMAQVRQFAMLCDKIGLYQRGRFGTLISRVYSMRARFLTNIREWIDFGKVRF